MKALLGYIILVALTPPEKSAINLQQNEYSLSLHRGEVVSVNKSIMHQLKIVTFKYNRTTTALNVTFAPKYNLQDFQMIMQFYRMYSNEYRVFPLRVQFSICNALKSNFGGTQNSYNCGNFTGCLFPKDVTKFFCNWVPDASKLPPHLPNGEYKITFQGLFRFAEMWLVDFYMLIHRPELTHG